MSLFGLFEQRSLENPALPLTSEAVGAYLGAVENESGMAVTERSSLHMPAVWRSVGLISSVSSSLPLRPYVRGTRDTAPSTLLDDPHPDLTPLELWRLLYMHRSLWGNGYAQKVRNRANVITELWPVMPDRVRVGKVPPDDLLPSGKVFEVTDDWGVQHALTSREILHIPGLGYDGVTGCSPVRLAAEGIGLAQAAEKSAARLYGKGNILSGVLQTEQRLKPDQAAALKAQWRAKMGGFRNSQEIAVLDSGATFNTVTMPYKDAQFLESREFQITEVARMFGVPLFLLMETAKSTSWGTGLEQQAGAWVVFDLGPTWLQPTEQRITKELLPANQYAKYSVQGLLRGDSSARATFYRAMRDVGAFSADDVRGFEEMPPLPAGTGGDVHLQPTYMAPLGTNPLAPDPAPAARQRESVTLLEGHEQLPAAVRAAAHLAEAHRLLALPVAPLEIDPAPEPQEGSEDDEDPDEDDD
ncbi:phage portal protein [Streptomyces sp. NPDC096013]|uniref:phage portal protein n=1 Tax=Streptomyces sp. NPDC096013 TaxID=3366069 RepID=UPI003826FEED